MFIYTKKANGTRGIMGLCGPEPSGLSKVAFERAIRVMQKRRDKLCREYLSLDVLNLTNRKDA